MMKKIIYALMMIFIMPLALSYSLNPDDYLFSDFGDIITNGTSQSTTNDGDNLAEHLWVVPYSTHINLTYEDDFDKIGNMSIIADDSLIGGKGSASINTEICSNCTAQVSVKFDGTLAFSTGAEFRVLNDNGNDMAYWGITGNYPNYAYLKAGVGGWLDSGYAFTGNWVNFTIYVNSDFSAVEFYIDGNYIDNMTSGNLGRISTLRIIGASEGSEDFFFDNVLLWEGRPENQPLASAESPPQITINSPNDNDRVNEISIDITTDVYAECNLSNSTDVLDTQISNLTATLTSDPGNLSYYTETFDITCIGENDLSSTESITLTIDTTPPFLLVNSPQNNSVYSGDMPIDLKCTDEDMNRINYTFYNGSILKSVENNTANLTELIIKDTIDTTLYADNDNYQLQIECADSHTKTKIKNKAITKDDTKKKIKWKNQDNFKEIEIYPDEITDVDDYFTTKQIDRYTFDYKLKKKKPITLNLKAEGLRYLGITESAKSPHFITKTNWIDFAMDIPAEYDVVKVSENHYKITITADTKDYHFKSVGDLNIKEEYYNVIIDNSPPVVSASISDTEPYVDDTISYDINCTDDNTIDELRIYNNNTGTLALIQTILSPTFTYTYQHTAIEGTITHRFDCVDEVSNTGQSSLYTYTATQQPTPQVERTELPLEDSVNIVGMLALFLLIWALFKAVTGGGKK